MKKERSYLAIDLGAESGRAVLGALDADRLTLTEVSRFPREWSLSARERASRCVGLPEARRSASACAAFAFARASRATASAATTPCCACVRVDSPATRSASSRTGRPGYQGHPRSSVSSRSAHSRDACIPRLADWSRP